MSYDRALEKAMRYCSYQERCMQDLEKRFEAWNVKNEDWDNIIDSLIKDNFLSEHRYVEAYVRGKFLMKKWGKNKIVMGLKQKRIAGEMVNKALISEISEDEYFNTIVDLILRKGELIIEKDELKKRDKIYRYMLSKGYESDLIVKHLPTY